MTVVVCPNLDDPDNGQVDHVSSPLVGAVAAYSCDELFCLIGGESRTCTAEGAWSGEEPICDGKSQPIQNAPPFACHLQVR